MTRENGKSNGSADVARKGGATRPDRKLGIRTGRALPGRVHAPTLLRTDGRPRTHRSDTNKVPSQSIEKFPSRVTAAIEIAFQRIGK